MIGNPFYNCVDMDSLKVKTVEFYKLVLSTWDDLKKMVDENEWDWLGDDFIHMEQYLSWISKHDKDFVYNVEDKNDSEYLEINTWTLPKKYKESLIDLISITTLFAISPFIELCSNLFNRSDSLYK